MKNELTILQPISVWVFDRLYSTQCDVCVLTVKRTILCYWALYYYCNLTPVQFFQPMAVQFSMKAVHPLGKRLRQRHVTVVIRAQLDCTRPVKSTCFIVNRTHQTFFLSFPCSVYKRINKLWFGWCTCNVLLQISFRFLSTVCTILWFLLKHGIHKDIVMTHRAVLLIDLCWYHFLTTQCH